MSKRIDTTALSINEVWKLPPLNLDQVWQLPVSCPLAYAARACDIGRDAALEMAAAGALDYMGQKIPVHRIGREWKVALPELLHVLGVQEPASAIRVDGAAEPAA